MNRFTLHCQAPITLNTLNLCVQNNDNRRYPGGEEGVLSLLVDVSNYIKKCG